VFDVTLELEVVRRLATEVARAQDDSLEVVAALTHAGGTGYTEILFTLPGWSAPRLISVGIDRDTSEAVFRLALTEIVRTRLLEIRSDQLRKR
jgi:hypothetical protein